MTKTTKKAEKAAETVEIPAVMCVVLEKFNDRTIDAVRKKGEVLCITEERFAELTAGKKWVAKVEPPKSEAEKAADEGAGGDGGKVE